MWPYLMIAGYCLLVSAASLAGGTLPSLLRLTHTRMQLIMSFVGGLVLAVALLHMLPHAATETGSLDWAVWATLAGLLTMFFLIRTFHVHRHGPVDAPQPAVAIMAIRTTSVASMITRWTAITARRTGIATAGLACSPA